MRRKGTHKKHQHHGHGAIAQLGERLPCKQEVSGSIPLGSTILEVRKSKKLEVGKVET